MKDRLNKLISSLESEKHATTIGSAAHAKLQFVKIGKQPVGDHNLILKITASNNELQSFFQEDSQTEVPIAGFINGHFISRRIDRLVINNHTKTIRILDYKTDTTPDTFRSKYIMQLNEYSKLLKQIYPDYKISCHILWLHNWQLENI